MITISLCMIVKNEEATLARCLSTVKQIVDEIIIVDTGSTDNTKKIAAEYTSKIFDFAWIHDFSAARNFSFQQASKEYILWMDADDILEESEQKKLQNLKKILDRTVDSVSMDYQLAFDGSGNVTHSLRRNRLVRRSCNFQWIGAVHEYLAVFGNVYHSDIAISHKKIKTFTDRNLQIYRKRQEEGEKFLPRDLYYFANELKDHTYLEEAVEQYQRFLDTEQGWIEDRIQAGLKMAECYERLGDRKKMIASLFRTMSYDTPRAEACCALGDLFSTGKYHQQAIFWYELATKLEKPKDSLAFVNQANWTWYPHLQLCVCYDQLGDHEKAFEHNEQAASFYPNHPSVLSNKKYFSQLHAQE